ncbi:Orn/Lys/Arg decarboxylase major region [Desulfofarcimen acetoxidans DSM 771]|uniref:Orn/Lys/Arg decarboxylase major region n=1 Tax=Desulfofarcimen acetoxidans (strain ATCC 49208 / DSM 771 / KCTC 5769 / VKM B-1644 / 5575) TaxID=485916 RepID=C8VY40_DESAS|nr:aminotransferase class I/II-fold pyridoxal phosphate-dependent enzyme [Desulfofarcimen acetoxidans]ACV64669.1 Orn/Lys/Arg decarboxylase major region [Desulfofarcimen acetoxidans DSM 771]
MGETQKPIINALKKYINDGVIRFHMPGHKGRADNTSCLKGFLGGKVLAADVTNVPGMDDLHQTQGVIKESQSIAASVYGADKTYFLINGSSCGLQALVITVCGPGDKILVPRNMHRSILSGIILSGAVPVFYSPEYDSDWQISLGTDPEIISNCLQTHPDIKAVLVVNPTYQGITSDIASIAEIVHARNIPLLVDEAHGPHFIFHERLPETSLSAGADAVVQGTHKLLSAFTQASMLHLKGKRVNMERLEATLRLLQSTSTSYLLLASLEAAVAQMAQYGGQLIEKSLHLSQLLRDGVAAVDGLSAFGFEITGKRGVYGLDQTKVTVSVKRLRLTGLAAEKLLREKHSIQVEMSDMRNLLFIVSFGNSQEDIERLINALKDLSQGYAGLSAGGKTTERDSLIIPSTPESVLTPAEAFRSAVIALPLEESVGRVCNEVIACYPPGIPVICPGERVSREIVDYLVVMRNLGMHFQGCCDAELKTIRVVK